MLVARAAERRLQIAKAVPPVELERRLHLRDGLQVAPHVQELSRRGEAALEQRVANSASARIRTQIHALKLAGQWVWSRKRCHAGSAQNLPAQHRDEIQRALPLIVVVERVVRGLEQWDSFVANALFAARIRNDLEQGRHVRALYWSNFRGAYFA